MIPNDIEPSLCTGEPRLDSLEDGFSPPPRDQDAPPAGSDARAAHPAESTLGAKSAF